MHVFFAVTPQVELFVAVFALDTPNSQQGGRGQQNGIPSPLREKKGVVIGNRDAHFSNSITDPISEVSELPIRCPILLARYITYRDTSLQ